MDTSAGVMLSVFGGLIAALLVVPRVLAWVARLIAACTRRDRSRERHGAEIAALLFLHSGPWLLGVTAGMVYFGRSLVPHTLLNGLVFGAGLGTVLYVAAIALISRSSAAAAEAIPLTPQLLRKMKRRYLIRWSLICGGLWGICMVIFLPQTITMVTLLILVIGSAVFGLMMSFMGWQLEWAGINEREYLRRQAERKTEP